MIKDRAKLITSLILFNSAYMPLYLILFIRDFKDDWLNIFKQTFFAKNILTYEYANLFNNGSVTFTILLISIVCCFIIIPINRMNGEHQIQITQIRNKSSEIVNYTVPFMVSFFSFDIGKNKDLISLIIFLLLLFLLSLRTQSIFVNPILALFNYGLYEIDYVENGSNKTCIFISNKTLVRSGYYQCTNMSHYLKLITKKV